MRLFIAVNIPALIKEGIHSKITDLQEEIRGDIRWLRKENWHITLKFLGEIEEKEIGKIKEIISSVATNNRQQSIKFSRIAAFPALEKPRVIYVGIDDKNDILQKLYKELEEQFSGNPSSSYTAHLTIGRVKDKADRGKISTILKEYRQLDFSAFEMKIDKISLMLSILKREGPIYKELYSINLMENRD